MNMGHEACRAVYKKLVEKILYQEQLLTCARSGEAGKLLDKINERDNLIHRLEEKVFNLESQLSGAERQLFRYGESAFEDARLSHKQEQEKSPEVNYPSQSETFTGYGGLEVDGGPGSCYVHQNPFPSYLPEVNKSGKQMVSSKDNRVSEKSYQKSKSDSSMQRTEDPSVEKSVEGSNRSVPKDFVEKLVNQYRHLKRILRDVLDFRGITITDYLNKCEFEDTITQLRQERDELKLKIDRLTNIINSKDNKEELMKLCSDQFNKISQLQRSEFIQRVLAEAYNQQYEKAKAELIQRKKTENELQETIVALKKQCSLLEEDIPQASPKKERSSTVISQSMPPTQKLQAKLHQPPVQASCAAEHQRQEGSQKAGGGLGRIGGRTDITVDGPSGPSLVEETDSKQRSSDQPPAKCPRCANPFRVDEVDKWNKHKKKCVD